MGITFQVLVECILAAAIPAIVIVLVTLLLGIIEVPLLSCHCNVLWNASNMFDEMFMRMHTAGEGYKSM